jgi:Ser/Thr protein kinase RdoA (MazF antagonist)
MVIAAHGEQGIIWRLETDDGVYAVKELLMPLSETEAAADVGFLETVGRQPSFMTPRPVRTVDGMVLADVGGRSVRVQTWVDIDPPNTELDPLRVGRLLAELHLVGERVTDPVHPWYTAPVGAAAWNGYVAGLARARAPAAGSIAAVVPTLLELEAMLAPPTDLRLCHRDLWADNLRGTSSGELCVIDWDNCGPADPCHELAMVLFEFGYQSPERVHALYGAYIAAGGPGRITDEGSFTMLIAQFGHFYEAAVATWVDAIPTADDVEWAQGRLAELESRPLTPAWIEWMLRTIAS